MNASIPQFLEQANNVIYGKEKTVKLALACLIAKGHLLLEDVPGVGKTTLAHTLATLLNLEFKRVQFTSDLLPADILGSNIFDRTNNCFEFHQGSIFSNVILADEINRATPKTQSALLEAMEERQVTIEKTTYPMHDPFMVIATQNPEDQIGTFPLPESQLDRFLMCLSIGFPDEHAEKKLLNGENPRQRLDSLQPAFDKGELKRLQQQLSSVQTTEPLIDYVHQLLDFSRTSAFFHQGLSPRAGIALIQSAKAWALIDHRQAVYPEDIQAVVAAVTDHRLQLQNPGTNASAVLLNEVAIP